jgi:heme exporter protein A
MEADTLSLRNVSCIKQQKKIFSAISCDVSSQEILLIEGENGAGKSSLLRLAAGLATPFIGTITWQNRIIQRIPHEYAEHLFYLGHQHGIKLGLTVKENILLAHHLNSNRIDDMENMLQTLQLSANLHTVTTYLSAGQKRRVALAKLFLSNKKIWILDEPLTALDVNTQDFCLLQFESHVKKGGLLILSSHHELPWQHQAIKKIRLSAC